jgi:hypothetical protein
MKIFAWQAAPKVRTAVLLAVGIGVLLSACGAPSAQSSRAKSTRGSAEAAARAAAPPITNQTPLKIPTTTTFPQGAVVRSTDVAPCRSATVQVTSPVHFAAAGTVIVYLQVVNVGNIRCSLEGYPKVLGLNSAGLRVAQAVEHDSGFAWGEYPYPQPPIVVLAPFEAAHATVFGNDYNFSPADCPVYPALSVTLPGDDVVTVVSMTDSGNNPGLINCGGSFKVNFIRPGQGDE